MQTFDPWQLIPLGHNWWSWVRAQPMTRIKVQVWVSVYLGFVSLLTLNPSIMLGMD